MPAHQAPARVRNVSITSTGLASRMYYTTARSCLQGLRRSARWNRRQSASPRHTVGFGRIALLINLSLQCSLDFGNLFVTAKGFLDPADYERFGQVGVRDEVVGALETDGAISTTGIGAVIGVHGVVSGKHEAVIGLAFQGVDTPRKGGGHG